jgi:hypothetical protein
VAIPAYADDGGLDNENGVRHVLLISIDGFHGVDFLNCSKGIPGFNGGAGYCPSLLALSQHGVNYTDATTSKPSDSFPGLTAIVSGGSPRSWGAFYDVAYDRALDPPAKTTGNGLLGAPGLCVSGQAPTGTSTEYEEGIDKDQSMVNGGGNSDATSIDPLKLPRDPARGCAPVYPWEFVRTNTIFGVIHAAGGYTAWSDKLPAYSSVSGPRPASVVPGVPLNLNDFYGPEINSNVVAIPNLTTPSGDNCNAPDTLQTGSWTDSFQNIRCYDTLKVNAIINEIKGLTHDGKQAKVPAIFGMNFQAVSVGQKLIEYNDTTKMIIPNGTGGYLDAIGTPSPMLLAEIEFVDKSIGEFIANLNSQGLWDSTLVIITAKHGQSPIDPKRFFPIPGPGAVSNGSSPASILCALLPASESPNCVATGITDANAQIGPTEDDISLIWLKDSSPANVSNAVSMLESQSPPGPNNIAGIGEIFWGPGIAQMFNPNDSRTPDIVVTPNIGVVYTGSKRKLAEHGGFAHDDTNVILLVAKSNFNAKTITSPVETSQVAPTILQALGLSPNSLEAVRMEGTQVLPGINFGGN